ncbi:hypothetical protein QQP08_003922 [Theobroma cacao]|uniref:Uncharacterized protein n=1 Tax=Theobroma cacao TaxID=3641 RepID=A0A061DHS8_THECC|nr:Uncharacterized protein TCM_000578 [Theobroma cacao]WRX11435.1 hypothetical protein QQP08_003922 [Theobroma cacao]
MLPSPKLPLHLIVFCCGPEGGVGEPTMEFWAQYKVRVKGEAESMKSAKKNLLEAGEPKLLVFIVHHRRLLARGTCRGAVKASPQPNFQAFSTQNVLLSLPNERLQGQRGERSPRGKSGPVPVPIGCSRGPNRHLEAGPRRKGAMHYARTS